MSCSCDWASCNVSAVAAMKHMLSKGLILQLCICWTLFKLLLSWPLPFTSLTVSLEVRCGLRGELRGFLW
jgi:hypothetical protein